MAIELQQLEKPSVNGVSHDLLNTPNAVGFGPDLSLRALILMRALFRRNDQGTDWFYPRMEDTLPEVYVHRLALGIPAGSCLSHLNQTQEALLDRFISAHASNQRQGPAVWTQVLQAGEEYLNITSLQGWAWFLKRNRSISDFPKTADFTGMEAALTGIIDREKQRDSKLSLDEEPFTIFTKDGRVAWPILAESSSLFSEVELAQLSSSELTSDNLFWKEVSKIPLLTPIAELRLAQILRYCRARREELTQNSAAGSAAEQALVAEGEHRAFIKLFEANLRIVVLIAGKYQNYSHGVPVQDLRQVGSIGLAKAVNKFDWTRGDKFSTCAFWWIKQQIRREIVEHGRIVRIPNYVHERKVKAYRIADMMGREPTDEELAYQLGITPDEIELLKRSTQDALSLEGPTGVDVDLSWADVIPGEENTEETGTDLAYREKLREDLEDFLGCLSKREREVINLRFGLEDGRARTLEEVGREFRLTRERIRQIEHKALSKLRARKKILEPSVDMD